MNLLDLPDELLESIFSHIRDTWSHGSLRQSCRKLRDMKEPTVFKDRVAKYTLGFDRRDVVIYDMYGNQVGSIKTMFPGYTKYHLRDFDNLYTRIYTPTRIVKIETTFKRRVKVTTTHSIDLRSGNKSESVICQTLDHQLHEDIGALGCVVV